MSDVEARVQVLEDRMAALGPVLEEVGLIVVDLTRQLDELIGGRS